LDTKATRDDQRVEGYVGFGKVLRRKAESARGGYEWLLGHHGQLVRTRLARRAGEFIGAGEDLERSSHVEKLDILEGQNLDPVKSVWRETRVLWHLRHTMRL
jgi:hypothetical protein